MSSPSIKLFLIQPTLDLDNRFLRIQIPYHGEFAVSLSPEAPFESANGVKLWKSLDMAGHVVSPLHSPLQIALSAFLETPVLLIHFQDSVRPVLRDQPFLNDLFDTPGLEDSLDYPLEECTTLADGYPFLIVTEQSFYAVSAWLEDETNDVRMGLEELIKRYRPNILIKGAGEPFEEDGWEEIRVGGDTMFPVSRCSRCPVGLCSFCANLTDNFSCSSPSLADA